MNHIKNKLRCRLTDTHFEPSAVTVGPHLSALPTVQSVVKEYAAPSFTLTAFSTTQGCVNSLRCTGLCRISRTFQRSRNMQHYHSHRLHIYVMMTCGLFSNMILCCIFYRTMFSSQSTHYPHNKRDVHVYIHVYDIYMYIIIYTVFPCLQDLARLKIALYILAHIPKSLLGPDIQPPKFHTYVSGILQSVPKSEIIKYKICGCEHIQRAIREQTVKVSAYRLICILINTVR